MYKYGRLAAKRPVGLRDIVHYLVDPLPAAPPVYPAPVYDWGVLANSEFGDCVWAGAVHLREAVATEDHETETFPTEEEVVYSYKTYTGCQEPGDQNDTGANEADILQFWHTHGLMNNKIKGYAPVNHRSTDELKSVVSLFGGSYLGVSMPAPAQDQFARNEPWDLTNTSADESIDGGHCVPAIGFDANFLYVVTWGRTQLVTWRWVKAYLEEAWAVLLTEDLVTPQLQADLARLSA